MPFLFVRFAATFPLSTYLSCGALLAGTTASAKPTWCGSRLTDFAFLVNLVSFTLNSEISAKSADIR